MFDLDDSDCSSIVVLFNWNTMRKSSKHIYGSPTNVTVTGGDGKTYHQVTATYDLNYADHLTQISQQLGNSTAVSDYTYDGYFCSPKQRKMNIRERVGTLCSRLEVKNSSFQHQTRVL